LSSKIEQNVNSILQLIHCLPLPPPFAAIQNLSPFLLTGKLASDDCQCSCTMMNFETTAVFFRKAKSFVVLLSSLLICCFA